MAVVQDAELVEVITDAESAKSLDRPGMTRLLAMIEAKQVDVVIIGKLDRLTRSVKDLGILLERFQKRYGRCAGCRVSGGDHRCRIGQIIGPSRYDTSAGHDRSKAG